MIPIPIALPLPRIKLPSPAPVLENKAFQRCFLTTFAACIGVGFVVTGWRRYKFLPKARKAHEEVMLEWIHQYHEEAHALAPGSSPESPDANLKKPPLEVDTDDIQDMWELGKRLGCDPELLSQLLDIAGEQLAWDLGQCLAKMQDEHDFSVVKVLPHIINSITLMGCQAKVEAAIWESALQSHHQLLRQNYLQLLQTMLISSRSRMVGIVLTGLVAFVCDHLVTESSDAFDQLTNSVLVIEDSTSHNVIRWACVHLFYSFLEGSVEMLRCNVSNNLTKNFRQDVDTTLYTAIASMDTEFFDVHHPQELNDLSAIGDELADADSRMQSTLNRIICVLRRGHFVLRSSPQLMIVMSGVSLLSSLVYRMFAAMDRVIHETSQSDDEDLTIDKSAPLMSLPAILQNIRTLRSFGRENDWFDVWSKHKEKEEDSKEAVSGQSFVRNIVACLSTFSVSYCRLLGMWVCTQAVMGGFVPEPVSLGVYQFVMQFLGLLQEIQGIELYWIGSCAAHANLLHKIVSCTPKIETEGGYIPHSDGKELQGVIQFKDVVFAYPFRPNRMVLRGFSLNIRKGQTVALVGHSGCGKSTIMSLMLRFYNPVSGDIVLDERSLEEYNPAWLRSQIAHVSQEVQLFNMSVGDNIRIARPDATRAEVVAAAKAASAYEFINDLPMGFKTLIGPHHFQLSGGQKQRIAIARALLMDAKILMLDEATSALDSSSQSNLQKALQAAMKRCTTLMITSRIAPAKYADQIAVITKGTLVELGTHDELMGLHGVYEKLVSEERAESFSPSKPVPESDIDKKEMEDAQEVAAIESVYSRVENPLQEDVVHLSQVHQNLKHAHAKLNELMNHTALSRKLRDGVYKASSRLGVMNERIGDFIGYTPTYDTMSHSPGVLSPTAGSDRIPEWLDSHSASMPTTPTARSGLGRSFSSNQMREHAAMVSAMVKQGVSRGGSSSNLHRRSKTPEPSRNRHTRRSKTPDPYRRAPY